MCSYFNPDCYWCKEYEQPIYECANMSRYFGDIVCCRDEDDERGCKDCPSLITDHVTAYHCTRRKCVWIECEG